MAIGTFARPTIEKKDKRTRIQLRLWLDAMCDRSLILLEEIDFLKSKRQFQSSFRDAFDLLLSLRRGEVDVLLRLFPWIEEHFKPKQDSPAVSEFALILKQQADILACLASGNQSLAPRNTPNHFDASDKMVLDALPSMFAPVEKVDASESRKNFAGGLGDLFGDDDEWDD